MAQDKTLSQGERVDMDKGKALIMERWTPLSGSRQRVDWGERPWRPSWMGKGSLPERIYRVY